MKTFQEVISHFKSGVKHKVISSKNISREDLSKLRSLFLVSTTKIGDTTFHLICNTNKSVLQYL